MEEKRQDMRFARQYIIIYSLKNEPQKTFDLSGMMDISKGGLKFASFENYPIGTEIIFHIKFPFLYPNATKIDGRVVGVYQIPNTKNYRVSVKFIDLDTHAEESLEQMERLNAKMGK